MKSNIQSWAFSCFIFLTISASVNAQIFSGQTSNRATINFDPTELYEQKTVINSADYKAAAEYEKEELLEAHFLKTKSALSSVRLYSKLKWVLGNIAAQALFFGIIKKANLNVAESTWLANSAGIGLGGLLMQSMHELSQTATASQYDPLEPYEIEYVRKKPKISRPLQKAIEENFTTARQAASIDRHLSFAKFAIGMPTEIMKVTSLDKAAFEAKFFKQNTPETFKGISRWTHRYLGRLDNPNFQKYAAYFHGPSRTGKTKAAEWIADFLSVPFEKINLGGRSVQDLFGTSKNSANPDPGLLVKALVKAKRKGQNGKNTIILLDEVDRLINRDNQDGGSNDWLAQFLTLLDPNTKSFYSDYFETEIDISFVGFILTGNNQLLDGPFKKRLDEIPFAGYTQSYKEIVIWEEWIPDLLNKQLSTCKLELRDLNKVDIKKMLEDDDDPGFRSIEWQVGQYFLQKDEEKCGWGITSPVS